MTEDEAKTKRCCGPEGCGVSEVLDQVRARRCIASECMAWDWEVVNRDLQPGDQTPAPDAVFSVRSTTEGDCGLKK